jgi:hypothetical protein
MLARTMGDVTMSIGLVLGLASIAFCQMAAVMAGAYLATGKLVTGRCRVIVSALIAGAYFLGRVQQAIGENDLSLSDNPEFTVVLVSWALSLGLLTWGGINHYRDRSKTETAVPSSTR